MAGGTLLGRRYSAILRPRGPLYLRRLHAAQGLRGPDLLTPRETELLRLFCRGLSYAQIADAAEIGQSTVRNTLDRVQHKAGAGSKTEMVVWAVRVGLLDGLE